MKLNKKHNPNIIKKKSVMEVGQFRSQINSQHYKIKPRGNSCVAVRDQAVSKQGRFLPSENKIGQKQIIPQKGVIFNIQESFIQNNLEINDVNELDESHERMLNLEVIEDSSQQEGSDKFPIRWFVDLDLR